MLHTVENDVELCEHFKISPGQLMFIKMLVKDPTYNDAKRSLKAHELAMRFQNVIGGLPPDELSDLVARDIIIDTNYPGKQFYEYYEINPRFANQFDLKVYPMPQELVDKYPAIFYSNNQRFIGVTASAEEIAKDYLRAINNDIEEHKKVIDDLLWAKENNGIIMGIKKFVLTKYWNVIRESRSKKQNQASDVTIL
jgi:hypothetical protein